MPTPVRAPVRGWLARSAWALSALLTPWACKREPSRHPPHATRSAPTAGVGASLTAVDLTPSLRHGVIDAAGPVVDLGEPQSLPFLVGTAPLALETVNGASWAAFGRRVRLRLPLPQAPADTSEDPSASVLVRLRVRRPTARSVSVVVDGLLVRSALLPASEAPTTLTLEVPADRFRRPVVDLELRFSGTRPPPAPSPSQDPRPPQGATHPPTAPRERTRSPLGPVVELDWVHLARQDVVPATVATLVNEVRLGPVPRPALTLFPPSSVSTVLVVPHGATWRASLSAEGPRGGSAPLRAVVARLVAESDGVEPLEVRAEVAPNTVWTDVSLDLGALAGRPTRLTVASEGNPDARLAVASPRLEHPPLPPVAPTRPVAHVVLVVVRGARLDRFHPALSARLTAGGFARMVREGLVVPAASPSGRELAALLSATTGLGADVHGVTEATDMLDEDAPTFASVMSGQGPEVRAFTDDLAWVGSGADREAASRVSCPNDAATCPPQGVFALAAEDLVQHRGRPTLTLVVTRAGVLPFAPTQESLTALAPEPYEGTLTPAQTGLLASRARRGVVTLEPPDQDRLGLLYDAAMLDVDRALAALLDRVRDAGLEGSTLVLVVGTRGTALGESGAVGDGPMTLASVATTVLLARGPGFGGRRPEGVVGVVDAPATALVALGLSLPPEGDGVSLTGAGPSLSRALPFVATRRGELGVRFADLTAIPRPGGLSLLALADDPLGQNDLAPIRPIARAYAEAALASVRSGEAGPRRVFVPSTRALPPPVEAAMRR